jgi:hypothetical protein
MSMRVILILAASLSLSLPAAARQADPAQVDAAIQNAAAFLLKKYEKGFEPRYWNSSLELVMLSLSHAKVAPDEPLFQKGLKELETCKLEYTYRVAGLAMALGRIDARKYQHRMAHCAQWLVDTQLADGEWGYPGTLSSSEETPKPLEALPPRADKKADSATIKIKRQPNAAIPRAKGDISNSQFAILGLKACADAGIEIPKDTWVAALAYMLNTQNQDGGWGYFFAGKQDTVSYASMTCAGVASVAICRHALGTKDVTKETAVRAGMAWLGKTFTPEKNANVENSTTADSLRWHYYYLYSIERVGQIIKVETLGKQKWYPAGAKFLLDKQKKDGSWWTGVEGEWKAAGDIETADTCFGILFLTRATPPLTATEDVKKK